MTLEDVILKINERVPDAENMDNHKLDLYVTTDGIEVNEPKIAPEIQRAFVEVLKSLKPGDCYAFIQHLLALKHYRDSTGGLWATDMKEFIDEHAEKLFKLEFTDAMIGWIAKGERLSDQEDDEDDDD